MLDLNIDEYVSREEVVDLMHEMMNKAIEKYRQHAADTDALRVYIKDMIGVPQACDQCPFFQKGQGVCLYRCKLGTQFPYGFKYKKERPEDCKLAERIG